MRLPIVNYMSRTRKNNISIFGGLNTGFVVSENEFSDMRNMSASEYPIIRTRKNRGKSFKTVTAPNGLFYKNGLFYIDGTDCIYNDIVVGSVSNGKKQLIGMGAYILIFPDKKYFNTHTKQFGELTKTFIQKGRIRFEPTIRESAFTKIIVDGLDFNRYDSIEISGCIKQEFNTTKVISEKGSNYIIVTGAIREPFEQDSGLVFKRNVPDMDFICESNNRIWGCSSRNHEIYASKLGDPFNWNNYEGISTDSYAVTIGSDGDFTGCISFMGHVLFFKENCIHKVFGNKASNFEVKVSECPGVRKGSHNSLQIIDETLYYVSRAGVYVYDGASPRLISSKLANIDFNEAVACQYKGRYYLSFLNNKKSNLFVYYPEIREWIKEDDTRFLYSIYADGKLVFIDVNNRVQDIEGDLEEKIDWYLESGNVLEGDLNTKHINKLIFDISLSKGSFVNILMKYDDDLEFKTIYTLHAVGNKTFNIPIIPRRFNKLKYRLQGVGEMKLIGISKIIAGGSEINGNV